MDLTTGLIENEAEIGLKSFHSYAVFGTIEASGKRMFLVKNTLPLLSPKLKYSWQDTNNWTEELKLACSYASYSEWGQRIFWTDIESIVENFEYLDINWNPERLAYRKTIWDSIPITSIINDKINLTQSPQYTVEFTPLPGDVLPETIFYVILTKLHTKEENLGPSQTPVSIFGEDLIGISMYLNDRYSKLITSEGAINELELTSETLRAFKFVIPKEIYTSGRHFNLVIRTHMRARDLYYK